MYKDSLEIIISKIENIEEIIKEFGNISKALENTLLARPAILMHLVAMAEQFDRLKKDEATEILKAFDEKDLKIILSFIVEDFRAKP